jgi:DNA polymerase IV
MPDRWPRTILHADMDAFYAAVEQHDRPELRGRPILVGHPGPRSVVTTASYEARPFGVGSAMPMAEARRRCPQAIVVPPRFTRYEAVSRQVRAVFDAFSPVVEPLSLDEAFLDLTGSEGLLGPPGKIAGDLKAAVREATGLTVSVGAAPSKYVAKVASDVGKPDGLVVVAPSEVRAFLAPLPIRRLWGAGPKTAVRLEAMGLATLGEVASCEPGRLEAALGSLGPHLWRLARGEDERPVIAEREASSLGYERTLETDVVGDAGVRPHLLAAAEEVARRLRAASRAARGVRVKVKTRDFRLQTRQCRLPTPAANADALYEAGCRLLRELDLEIPMRLVGLAAFDLVEAGAPVQADLFASPATERRRGLDEALDAIDARFGRGAVRRASDARAFGGDDAED